jgi:hypothetical protein
VLAFYIWYYEKPNKNKTCVVFDEGDTIIEQICAYPHMAKQPDDYLKYDDESGGIEVIVHKNTTAKSLSVPDHIFLQ